ncbi:acyltransferase [Bradyrhizobium barranii subsp. barranii]|uniref:Acyltransferase n=1 Tax=Bradyrhizobium barranii subsp. barranii TaxID=2823807 RepID=A0A7Z0TNF2_9BRAD|nr:MULTISPECIES: acyltransferase [Bradyrhizobium]UEM17955.1 acyltransferase [Bradyrhizobium barranii subsp. barranii]UGX91772.1 acyltransferase [Bradyrhizobium barranii subsp. barranii]UQE03596.1 acyltransferase [Bradyrhizobium japonicum]
MPADSIADGPHVHLIPYPAWVRTEPRNADIEALRGYAISITIIAHLGTLVPEWGDWTGYFWLGGGVDLFFCLSGFLITRSLLASLQTSPAFGWYATTFWVRRIFRLFPAAVFWSTVVFFLSLAMGDLPALGLTSSLIDTWTASFFNVVNLHIYYCYTYLSDRCSGNALWHYWSLSLEEQFYLFISLNLFFVRRPKSLIILFLAGALTQAWIQRPWGGLLWFIRSDALLFGCVTALSMHHQIDARIRQYMRGHRLVAQALLGFFMTTLIVTARAQISTHYMGLVSLSAGAIVFIVASDSSYLTKARWMEWIARYAGSRSYSLYLVHLPTLALTRDATLSLASTMLERENGRMITLLVAIVAALALAEISYRFLEEPLRLFGRRITQRRSAFSLSLLSRKVPVHSIIAGCFVPTEDEKQQEVVRQERNRSGMTLDHESASSVSDTLALTQPLRQG